jgi:hypothetical protein
MNSHLLTNDLIQRFPRLYETDGKPQTAVKIVAKFFTPHAKASWYATEYDPEERVFFGFANLGDDQMAELGYFSLSELESLTGPFGPKVVRDRFFEGSLEDVVSFRKR